MFKPMFKPMSKPIQKIKKNVYKVMTIAAILVAIFLTPLTLPGLKSVSAQPSLTPLEQLGKFIFFDDNLSEPAGQSCATCHDPATGFAEPHQVLPVSEGAVPGRFGSRNAPSAAYAAFSPKFSLQHTRGGQLWDGRAPTLLEQAKLPFLGANEMNNPSPQAVLDKIAASDYANLFLEVFGPNAFNNVDKAYHKMARAIAAFEKTKELNRFASKFDAHKAGLVHFTPTEALGEKLFNGKANCWQCHPTTPQGPIPIVFTNFDYQNLGVPQNTEYPFDLQNPIPIDHGLGDITNNPQDIGKFKIPTLRNIARTPPYTHNGLLKTLKDVVHFINTRDISNLWGPPEVPANVEHQLTGNLGLTNWEEDAIVAFLETLTDGHGPGGGSLKK